MCVKYFFFVQTVCSRGIVNFHVASVSNCFKRFCNYFRKIICLEIIEEDSYEKDALFYVELGDPLLQGGE